MHSIIHFFAPVSPHGHLPEYLGKMAFGVLLVFGVLALLQAAPRRYRKVIIAVFTFLGGIYYALEFFWPTAKRGPHTGENFLTQYNDVVSNLASVIGSFAIGLGVFSLLQYHGKAIYRQRAGWGNSIAFLVSFALMAWFGIRNQYHPTERAIPGTSITSHDIFQFLFQGGLNNLDAAMFSIIAFYIASASYRAFRIRSVESTLLMISALVVMLGSVTFGTALTNWIAPHDPNSFAANFRIERAANWLMTVVNAAAQRGILFGLTVGGLAVSLRLWLSLERSAYFDQEL